MTNQFLTATFPFVPLQVATPVNYSQPLLSANFSLGNLGNAPRPVVSSPQSRINKFSTQARFDDVYPPSFLFVCSSPMSLMPTISVPAHCVYLQRTCRAPVSFLSN